MKSAVKIHRHLAENIALCLKEIFLNARPADRAIEYFTKNHPKWGSKDRRFFAEGVYEVVRWKALLLHLRNQETATSVNDFLDLWILAQWKKYGIQAASGYASQLDRPWDLAFVEKQFSLLKGAKDSSGQATLQSIPQWMYDWGLSERGERWPEILSALNEPAKVDLRVNTYLTDKQKLKIQLEAEGILTDEVPGFDSTLTLRERKNVFVSKAYLAGLFEVQDRASQKVAEFLNPKAGERIIDACAGAGGKTLHLASLMQNKGKIISLDVHEGKLAELSKRARRNKFSMIETRVIESTKVIKRLEKSADRVLLDVPCSGMGVLRRNPWSKWSLTLDKVNEVRSLQKDILSRYSQMVKSGGFLGYSTCSLMPSENEQQVTAFLSSNSEFKLIKEFHIDPDTDQGDGFFCALMQRQ